MRFDIDYDRFFYWRVLKHVLLVMLSDFFVSNSDIFSNDICIEKISMCDEIDM